MKVKIHDIATMELDEAIEWYEIQSKGLGKCFKKAVIDKLKKIKQNPNCFLRESDNIYKAYIPKFPYKILFTSDKEEVVIWAIAHMHREPWYWQSRMN